MSATTPGSDIVALRVHVPIACFRKPYSREYLATYPIAPPSTVYGMLLSMVGETNRLQHKTARLIVGRLRVSERSSVLRTTYRWKDKEITSAKNRTPDWQDLLTDVRLAVWLTDGLKEPEVKNSGKTLRQRVQEVMEDSGSISRFGGLSLGESTHLVDGVWFLRGEGRYTFPEQEDEELQLLHPREEGDLTVPIWPDHVSTKKTRWGTFSLEGKGRGWGPEEDDRAWTSIAPL